MKESIFFNRQQLKIIRQYWFFHQIFFEYWTYIFAFLFSILFAIFLLGTSYFQTVALESLVEPVWSEEIIVSHQHKEDFLTSFASIEPLIINGQLGFTSGLLVSQNLLLNTSGFVLPREVYLSSQNLSWMVEAIQHEKAYVNLFNSFFSLVLKAPLNVRPAMSKPEPLLALSWSLKDSFSLWCLDSSSKHSFVCKTYLNTFLSSFFFYNLGPSSWFESSDLNYWTSEASNPFSAELVEIYGKIKNKRAYKQDFCSGLLSYVKYGGFTDDKIADLVLDCGSQYYTQFMLLKNFSELTSSFNVGYVWDKTYSDPILNEYKLFSLQQLLYKNISSWVDPKSLLESYISFLRSILIREWNNHNLYLVSPFAKSFTYWYHVNVLSPYLSNENSKINKEDRTHFSNQLLLLNYWDKISNFIGLEKQSSYSPTVFSWETGGVSVQQNLEHLFKTSYLPAGFALVDLEQWKEENTLQVNGVDKKTEFALQALLKYQDLQLFVEHVQIENNPKLSEYLNLLVKNDRTSLNRLLGLIDEHREIATQQTPLDLSLCSHLKAKYDKKLTFCTDTKVEVTLWAEDKEKTPLVYTFTLSNQVLKGLQVSDKVLETKLLKELDLASVDKNTTYYMITSIVGYVPQESSSWFWMKEYLLVSDKFSKYLHLTPDTVEKEDWVLKVFFTVKDVQFIGTYDLVTNRLDPIALDFWTARRPVIVQWLVLLLRDQNIEQINGFVLDPISFLKKINPALVRRYFPER